jgi:polyphosphate kinase 2 (PPK2 family)
MFDSAEIGHKIDKATYKAAVPALRAALLEAQNNLQANKKIPVVVLISGQDGAGKGETINVLYEWMDPRFISTLAFSLPSDEERERPPMWRYWRSLPPKGRVGIFAGSWYSDPIRERILGEVTLKELDAQAEQINRFEAMLVNEGALVLKFWFHLTKDGQVKRLKDLERDPRTAWRVTQWNWDRLKTYDKLQDVAGHLLRLTNTPWAPWVVVEGTDDRYRSLTVGQILLQALQKKLASTEKQEPPVAPMVRVNTDGAPSCRNWTSAGIWTKRRTRTIWPSGKAGSPSSCATPGSRGAPCCVPLKAPMQRAREAPYGASVPLWTLGNTRSFRWPPRPKKSGPSRICGVFGAMFRARVRSAIFDRTWYGRVLVERVEGFCTENDWLRAYTEINDFEHELADSGVMVVKFWLQISQQEQLKRFKAREQIAFKRFKITQEDWRNREKWDAYQQAICDMVERTSTGNAPWTLVEANDKNYARIKILRTLCERVQRELDGPRGAGAKDGSKKGRSSGKSARSAKSENKKEKAGKSGTKQGTEKT